MRHATAMLALALLFLPIAASCNRDGIPGVPAGSDGGSAAIDGGTGLPTTAYAARDCAPNDGPAVTVLLYTFPIPECSADPGKRSVRIYLHDGADRILPITPPVTITSTDTHINGSVTDCLGGGAPCRSTSDFTVTFESFSVGGPARGALTARFPEGPESGAFNATWCEPVPPICG